MAKHARFSPSKLENLSICPCFEYKESTDDANEGKLLHHAYETGDETGLDQEQKNAVQAVRDVMSNIVAGIDEPLEVHKEVEVELEGLTYGYVDDQRLGTTIAIVADAKFGRKGATEAERNFQVRTYCAATMEKHQNIQKCIGVIIAPRTSELMSRATFDRSLIAQVRKEIEELYLVLNDPFKKPCAADPELCAKCAHAARCPLVGSAAVAIADKLGLPMPTAFSPDAIVSPEDRSVAQSIAGALENWAEQVKKNNSEFAKQGGEIPGFELRSKSTGFRIPKENTAPAWQALVNAGYLPQTAMLGAMTMSVPELAKRGVDVRGTSDLQERETLYGILEGLGREGEIQYLQKLKKSTKKTKLLG